MRIIVALMVTGLTIFSIGVIKSVKSRFTDLNALIWVFAGHGIFHIGLGIMGALI